MNNKDKNQKRPIDQLRDGAGAFNLKTPDDESAIFKVWESAATSGINLSTVDMSALFPSTESEPKMNYLDDFLGGFINGRLNLLVEDDVIVKEVKCQANGNPCCEFLAELD